MLEHSARTESSGPTLDAGLVLASSALAAIAFTLALATREQLPDILIALPVFYAVAIVAGLVATYLLRVRANAESDRGLAWVAAGYAVATLAMFVQILGFPSFAPGGGPLGTTSTGAAGLYVVWHLAIPLFALCGATARLRDRTRLRRGLLVAASLLTIYVAWGGAAIPTLIDGDGRYTPTLVGAMGVLTVLSAAAVARWFSFSGRKASWSHAWITASLVLCFWDIAMHSFAQERFTVFWWSSLAMRVSQYVVLAVGLLVGFVSLYRQIAARVVELDTTQFQAEQARDQMRAYTHQLAHDLRAPLTVAMGVVDTVEMHGGGFDARIAHLLARATQKHRDMASMIEDLARYGDAESGHLVASPVDLTWLVADVASDIPEATVTVESLFPVRADETALRRVFVNLLTNAVKYSRPGVVPTVEVRGRADGATWVIEVEDNGRGIPAEQLEAVFDPYRRLEAANSAITGSGLGLAVCRRLVERHGGTISARSDAETGTTFMITLPRVTPPSARTSGTTSSVFPSELG